MKAYLANSLFSQADRDFNEKIAMETRLAFPDIDLYVPQENMSINDKSKIAKSSDIVSGDMIPLMSSDFLIAIIDGNEIDAGVAAEIGAFYTTGRPIYALCTDERFNNKALKLKMEAIAEDPFENQIMYRNLLVVGLIKENGILFDCKEDLEVKMKMLAFKHSKGEL